MAQDQIPGFPPDIKFFSLEKFKGINTKALRQSIDDQQFSWLENWMPIGDGNMRTLYGKGATLYNTVTNGGHSSSVTIIYYFHYNIGAAQHVAIFLSDGTADDVLVSTGAVTVISGTNNTFYNGGNLPSAQQYGNSGIVICDTVTSNGYYAWDGTLYAPTFPAPTWLSGLTAPYTPTGNTHTSTLIDSISVLTGLSAGMSVTGTGIQPGTVVVTVTPGSGSVTLSLPTTSSLTGITLTFTWAMPTGISGTTIEVYQGRVWVFGSNQYYFSAGGNGADFSASDGGGSGKSNDSFLKQKYVKAIQSSGFLYVIADSSINSISNVQSQGSPLITTFNNLNVDPQVGTPWTGTVQEFGEGIVFANTSGVYVLYGGSARKVSDDLDGLFSQSNLPLTGTSLPTAAVATIFGIKVYILLLPGAVDYKKISRPLMCIWDGKKWFLGSQEVALEYIDSQEVLSQLNAWGTDNKNLFPIFTTSSLSLNKIIQGKLWPGDSYIIQKQAMRAYIQIQDNVGSGVSLTVNTDTEATTVSSTFSTANDVIFTNASGGAIQFQNSSSGNINFTVAADAILAQNDDIGGQLLGFTMTTAAQDATLITASLAYRNVRGLY